MMSANPIRLPLCEYDDALGRQTLSAVIDELTLTYCVVDRESRTLREHLPSLQDARRSAAAYRDERERAATEPEPNDAVVDLPPATTDESSR
jgi:hypothetical protein